jgi:hypothetical protein
MRTNHKATLAAAVALATLTCSALAFGGSKYSLPVVVDLATNNAYGAIGSARASSDSNQIIGCETVGLSAGPENTYGYCFAYDANANLGMCNWTGATWATAVASITPMTRLNFSWDSSGNCTQIDIGNWSFFPPPVP